MNFDFSQFGESLTALIVALTGLLAGSAKLRSDKQAAQGDRFKQLEEKVDKIGAKLDAERAARRRSEDRAHRLSLGLASALARLEDIYDWLREGMRPPPPDTHDLSDLRRLIESDS